MLYSQGAMGYYWIVILMRVNKDVLEFRSDRML